MGTPPHNAVYNFIFTNLATIASNSIPLEIISCRKLPKVPRTSFCAISLLYRAVNTQSAPVDIPVKNRPAYTIPIDFDQRIKVQPVSDGTMNKNALGFLPNLSHRGPAKIENTAAPNDVSEAIHESSFLVIVNPNSPPSNFSDI
uniref:Uncharacterized protein n=1 Tax=Photinus pyralis TaxID=7054 RepID=A0A1Y1KW12_PHOPY